jgi:hypothetical protein
MSTKEEAFFGVKNDVTMPAPEIDDDVEIEFVDDTPEKDKPYVKPSAEIIEQENKKSLQEETTDDDEETEISKVSKNVNKRIKQLTKQYHEERRSKESAQRISDEALRATEKLMNENKRLSELVRKSQEAMEAEAKLRADADIKLAEDQFKIALDSADNSAIVEAQKRLTDAQMLKLSRPSVFDTPEEQWAPQEQ